MTPLATMMFEGWIEPWTMPRPCKKASTWASARPSAWTCLTLILWPPRSASLRTNRAAFGDDAEGDDAEGAEGAGAAEAAEGLFGALVAKRRMGVGPWPASRAVIRFSTSRKPRSSDSIFL